MEEKTEKIEKAIPEKQKIEEKEELVPENEEPKKEGKVLWVSEEKIGVDFNGYGIEIPFDKKYKNLKSGDTIYF
ncbi:MAG TPA: hypothetical protein PLT50_01435 [bacterium]|jgi:FKBP-type peptidyl-prolyl cis-trans isomerase 2|nr:hypothetical protein [bacterium]